MAYVHKHTWGVAHSFHVLFTYTWHLNLKTAKSRQTKTLKNNLEFLLPQPTFPRQLIKSKLWQTRAQRLMLPIYTGLCLP